MAGSLWHPAAACQKMGRALLWQRAVSRFIFGQSSFQAFLCKLVVLLPVAILVWGEIFAKLARFL